MKNDYIRRWREVLALLARGGFMSLADLQPTERKASFKETIVSVRGFTHPEVKGLFIHILESPFESRGNLCSLVHIESTLAVLVGYNLTTCYEVMMLTKHLNFDRSGHEVTSDMALQDEYRKIVENYMLSNGFVKARL